MAEKSGDVESPEAARLTARSLSQRDRMWIGFAAAAVLVALVVILTKVLGGPGGPSDIETTDELYGEILAAFGVEGGSETLLNDLGALLVPRGADVESVDDVLTALAERLGPEHADATPDELIAALVQQVDPDGEIGTADELIEAVTVWAQGVVLIIGSPELVDGGIAIDADFEQVADAVESGRVTLTLPFPGVPALELWRSDVSVDRAERTLAIGAEADYLGLAAVADLGATWHSGGVDVTVALTMDRAGLSELTPSWPAAAPQLSLDDVVVALATSDVTRTYGGSTYDLVAGANLFGDADLGAVPEVRELLAVVGITAETASVTGSLGPGGGFITGGDGEIAIRVVLEGITTPASWVNARLSTLRFTADATGASAVFEDQLDVSIGGSRQVLTGSLSLDGRQPATTVDIAYRLDGDWARPFGVAWLTMSDVALEASFAGASLDRAVVGGGYRIAGKTGRLELAVDDDGRATATGTLSDLSLSDVVAVMQDVAGVDLLPEGVELPADALALEDVSISFDTGDSGSGFTMAATTVVAGLRADGLVGVIATDTGTVPFLSFNAGGLGLGDVVPELAGDPVVDLLALPDATFTLTSGESRSDAAALSPTARGFFRDVYGTDDFTVDLAPGLNLGGTVPGVGSGNVVGDFMELLGMDPDDPLMMRGTVPLGFIGGGGGTGGFAVEALLPEMVPSGPSAWFESAQLGIEVTGAPSVGVTGSLTVDIDGDIQTFDIDAKIGAGGPGVAASLTGSLGNPWVSPFDVEWLTMNDVTLLLAFDATGNVTIGFGGDMLIGEKDIAGAISVSLSAATGVPTNFAFQGGSTSGVSLGDLADLYAAMSGEDRPPVEAVLPEMEVRDIAVRFAPRPVPELGIEQGFALAGELWVAERQGGPLQRFVVVDIDVGESGIFAAGFLAAYRLGPLEWDDANVALEVSAQNQMFALSGAVALFDASQSVEMLISRTEMAFATETTITGFAASLGVAASYDFLDPSFRVTAAMSSDFADAVGSSSSVEVQLLRAATQASIDSWRRSRSAAQDIIDDALDIIDGAIPSNCNTLVLNVLINACEDYHDAIEDVRRLNRQIDDALTFLESLPTSVTVDSASFTAGFEGFEAGSVSMTIGGSAGGRRFSVTLGWDFNDTLAQNAERLVDLLV